MKKSERFFYDLEFLGHKMEFTSHKEREDFIRGDVGKAMTTLEKEAIFITQIRVIVFYKIKRTPENIQLIEYLTEEKVEDKNMDDKFVYFRLMEFKFAKGGVQFNWWLELACAPQDN